MRSLLNYVVGVVTILSGCGDGPTASPFFFLQMADTKFGMYSDNESFEQETALFTRAIEHANRLMPEFVIICGDLINRPGDPVQREELLRIC
ncbi:MAG: hypothetical protein VYA69_08950, partial [Gemmatimonadota bacterium]|nr:hypothetical protein [Gemmatimonadota bacterium]